jgi:hypothetical protein
MFPVEDAKAKDLVLRELRSQLRDDVNACELRADGSEERRWGGPHDCQRMEGNPRVEVGPRPAAPEWTARPGAEQVQQSTDG